MSDKPLPISTTGESIIVAGMELTQKRRSSPVTICERKGTSSKIDTHKKHNKAETPEEKAARLKHKKWRRRMFDFMDSSQMQAFLGVLLMISLFISDSWVLGDASNSADDGLYGILTFVFIIFVFEVVTLSIVQDGYLDYRNFFFWMDILGTASIILDIGWISSLFMPSGTSTNGSLLRAARAAKLGARYGRIMRLLKLMKFFHFLPCWKNDDEDEKEPTMTAVRQVSNQLSSVLSKRVACLVLFMVIVVPFMSYTEIDYSTTAWVDTFTILAGQNMSTGDQRTIFTDQVSSFFNSLDTKLVSLDVESPYFPTIHIDWSDEDDIRWQNVFIDTATTTVSGTVYNIELKTDQTIIQQWNALFGILLILLVIVVLFGFSASFHNAVDVLVVVPLEKMMSALRESATMMLRSMKALDKEDEEGNKTNNELDDLDEELETAVLERMVEKLARLCKHMLPETEVEVDKDIDDNTAEWLRDMATGHHERRKSVQSEGSIHLKEGVMSDETRLAIYEKIGIVKPDLVNSLDFDTTLYTPEELAHIARYCFDMMHCFDEFGIVRENFELFVFEIGKFYEKVPYHNFAHCIDVTHTTYRLFCMAKFDTQLSTLEVFSALLAALGHDMGHFGMNNAYLIKSKHDLAIRFNDVSPLENMHCSKLFELLANPKFNILAGFTDPDWREVRKLVIKAILGTDMTHHFETVKKMSVYYEVHSENLNEFYSGATDRIESFSEWDTRANVIEWILHTADVSNPYKPFTICSKWAKNVVNEFWAQGDRERDEHLDVPVMNDRTADTSLCESQMGFIQFAIEPLVTMSVKCFPALHPIGTNLVNNYQTWAKLRETEIDQDTKITNKDEAKLKVRDRSVKFGTTMAWLKDCIEIATQ